MDTSLDTARFNMVQQQIRPWDVNDHRVLETLAAIPRERFVPAAYRGLAYADIEIPLGEGQTMLAPKIIARLLQALSIAADERILEIGTGSGYLTACLSHLGDAVISLEIDPDLAALARQNLAEVDPRRLEIREGDGLAGHIDGGPFDVIAVTGSLPDASALEGLEAQLAPHGRLFAIVGLEPAMQATLVTHGPEGFSRQALFETSVPALAKAPEPERFVF
ncbi:MAG: protein-L-isoaspartate O-methyltransferase [Chromatiaceae bacterium]|jgi:protein-L-isoaspartate(D-aspartate) O-methyltransferase|nr:protein-L-isoaspartate O-methyltransferase [Chromatiaceae bacterium]